MIQSLHVYRKLSWYLTHALARKCTKKWPPITREHIGLNTSSVRIAFQNVFVIYQTNHGVGRYFTVQEIFHFRELQATTGAIISGSTALQFFDRTVYADSDLDIYVQHDRARDLALWLDSIGYTFVPLENDNFKTLQMSLDKSPDFDPTDITFDNEYCDGVIILNFIKEDQPSIQVITSRGPPLGMVLQFHSSASFFFLRNISMYSLNF